MLTPKLGERRFSRSSSIATAGCAIVTGIDHRCARKHRLMVESLVIHAASRESALGLCPALADFDPMLVQGMRGHWQVEIPPGGGTKEVLDLLRAKEDHVSALADGPARLDRDGHQYTLHPTDAA